MEDLIATLNDLIEVIKDNSVPMWITIIGVFVPILISILVLWLSVRQNKKNIELQEQMEERARKLQKEICNRDIKAQIRGDILKIYDNFYFAQNTIAIVKNSVHVTFSDFNMSNQWVININTSIHLMFQATDRANLLLPASDQELRKVLETILDKYKELKDKIDEYYHGGEASSIATMAWHKISSLYTIPFNNYNALKNNPDAHNTFLQLCENNETKEINNMITEILPLFSYDKFDKYFKPYLQMNLLDDNT